VCARACVHTCTCLRYTHVDAATHMCMMLVLALYLYVNFLAFPELVALSDMYVNIYSSD
jgi:hypothetical protein